MIIVPLFDLKFLTEFAAGVVGTSNRRHYGGSESELRSCQVYSDSLRRWGLPAAVSTVACLRLPIGSIPSRARSLCRCRLKSSRNSASGRDGPEDGPQAPID